MSKSNFTLSDYHQRKWFDSRSWQGVLLVGGAVKLNIFITLSESPLSAEDLARKLQLDERATAVTLEALRETGHVRFSNNRYSLTDSARASFGNPKAPEYLGWSVLHSWRLMQRWLTLPEVVKSGKPLPGDRFSETVEGFIRAMDVYAKPTGVEVVDICLQKVPQAAAVLDIGGATGTVSKLLSDHGIKVTLFDIPEVIETIRDEITRDWPSIALEGGDFNQSIPGGPFDIVFLGNVTHIYGPENNRRLFKRVFDQLRPGGFIAIQDYLREASSSAPIFAINMLVNTESGGTWTKVQYSDWLADAGFSAPEILDLNIRDQQLILAKK